MEFFIPGLAVLLLIALIVFLVLPRFGAPLLALLSLALLFYGVNQHMSLFYSEYRYATWQDQFKVYGPFIIIGIVIVSVLGYMGFLFGTGAENTLPASNMSAITAVMNATRANTSPGIVNTLKNTVNNVTAAVSNAVTGANQANRGIAANLGNILASPFNRNAK
jgi:hypothetical protein